MHIPKYRINSYVKQGYFLKINVKNYNNIFYYVKYFIVPLGFRELE